jgi:glycosyltransferase involved in cell wall biosynthesis
VTVVIPTRDRWSLLSRTALRAAVAQSGVDLEIIVVDDGSSEEAPDDLPGLDDPRVRRVRHVEPRGVAAARNAGLREARGEWIAFLDDDDVWSPQKLRRQIDAVRAAEARFAYAGAIWVERDGLRLLYGHKPPRAESLARELLRWNVLWGGGSNVLAAADLLHSLGGFDERLFQLADWDLWIRLARAAPAAVVDEVLVALLVHRDSMLLVDRRDVFAEFDYLRAKHREVGEQEGTEPDRARFARWAAAGYLRAGRRRAAARTYVRGAVAPGNVLRAAAAFLGPSAFAALSERRGSVPGALGEGERVARAPEWLGLYR